MSLLGGYVLGEAPCDAPLAQPPALRVSGKQPVLENANLWTSDDCKRVLFQDHAAIGHDEIFATATRDVHFLQAAVGGVKKTVKCFFEAKRAVFHYCCLSPGPDLVRSREIVVAAIAIDEPTRLIGGGRDDGLDFVVDVHQ